MKANKNGNTNLKVKLQISLICEQNEQKKKNVECCMRSCHINIKNFERKV